MSRGLADATVVLGCREAGRGLIPTRMEGGSPGTTSLSLQPQCKALAQHPAIVQQGSFPSGWLVCWCDCFDGGSGKNLFVFFRRFDNDVLR